MKQIYVIKNCKANFWETPIVVNDPKDVFPKEFARACILDIEGAKKAHRDECEIYWIGEYDDERGIIKLAEDKEFLFDLSTIFPKEAKYD